MFELVRTIRRRSIEFVSPVRPVDPAQAPRRNPREDPQPKPKPEKKPKPEPRPAPTPKKPGTYA